VHLLLVHVGAIGRLQEFDRSEARDGLNDAGFVDGRNVVIELPAGPGGTKMRCRRWRLNW